MRMVLSFTAVLVVLAACPALAGVTYATFSDPTHVNLLERWNADGSYYYATDSNVPSRPLWRAQVFKGAEGAFHGGMPAEGIDGTYDLGQTMPLGEVSLLWRDAGHTPSTWTIYAVYDDERGSVPIVTGKVDDLYIDGRFNGRWSYTIPGGLSASALRIIAPGDNGNVDLPSFGAYLSPGNSLAMDGTFNIFYEENYRDKTARDNGLPGTMTVVAERGGSAIDASTLTDLGTDGFNCYAKGSVEWTLSQAYTFVGAYLSKYTDRDDVPVMGLTIDVHNGTQWVNVYTSPAEGFHTSSYLSFTEVTGSKVRMSWEDTEWGGGREISEFQLFGYIAVPEPATMGLLVLGGLALLRRRAV